MVCASVKALLSVLTSGLCVFLMGGIVFGVASLYPVLFDQRVLVSACGEERAAQCAAEDEAAALAALATDSSLVPRVGKCCEAQQLSFTLISSVALFMADGVMILYGELADRCGPRACFGTGAVLCVVGLLSLFLASLTNADAAWPLALGLLGSSGPGIFMGVLFLSEKFPALHALVTSLCASMWDSSALVFLLFQKAHFDLHLDLGPIALGWLALCLPIAAVTYCVIPSHRQLKRLRAAKAASEKGGANSSKRGGGGGRGRARPSFCRQFCRSDTLLLLLFMAIYNLKSSFYITTMADQMSELFPPGGSDGDGGGVGGGGGGDGGGGDGGYGDGGVAEQLALTFDIAFPVGGLLTTPVASALLGCLAAREHLYMAVVLTLAVCFGMATLLMSLPAQYAAAMLFGPTRTLQWAAYFHFLTLPSRYAPEHTGRLLGVGNLVIALVGDVPPSMLNAYVTSPSDDAGDDASADAAAAGGSQLGASITDTKLGRYLVVHLALQAALCVCLLFPLRLLVQHQRDGGSGGGGRHSSGPMTAAADEEGFDDDEDDDFDHDEEASHDDDRRNGRRAHGSRRDEGHAVVGSGSSSRRKSGSGGGSGGGRAYREEREMTSRVARPGRVTGGARSIRSSRKTLRMRDEEDGVNESFGL